MEQRKLPRAKLTSLLKVVDGPDTHFGETVDISLTGLSCQLAKDYEDTQPVLISFRLEIKERPITTWVSPVWSVKQTDGRFRLGMRFLDLDSNHYSKIADFVAGSWVQTHRF